MRSRITASTNASDPECRSGRPLVASSRRPAALDRADHFQDLPCRADFVAAKHHRPVGGGQGRGRQGARHSVVGVGIQDFAEEVLVGQGDQHRPSRVGQRAHATQDVDVVLGVLAIQDAKGGIDEDTTSRDSLGDGRLGQPRGVLDDGRDDVRLDIERLFVFLCADARWDATYVR